MRTCVLWVALVAAASLAWAKDDKPARPTELLTLADFETAESAALWEGIAHAQADGGSQGAHGLRFEVPAYVKGQEERPGVRLPFADGKGLPFRDFSRYGRIAVDVRVEGDGPGKLGLKLRDIDGDDSWTTHITVEPGKWNTAELAIADAASDIDVSKVDAVVLYALRPETAFALVVDDLRLLPAEKPPLATFTLRYPNYRGMIFPDGGKIEVDVAIEAEEHGIDPESCILMVSLSGGGNRFGAVALDGPSATMTLSATHVVPGPQWITAALLQMPEGRKVSKRLRKDLSRLFSPESSTLPRQLAVRKWPVRVVTPEEQAALKVYIDRANNLIVDGKPFFPLGWYGNSREDYLAELADSPFNCLLAYATDHVPKDRMLRFLDLMQEKGMKLVYCMNDVYPTATYFEGKGWEGVTGNEQIAAAVMEAYKDHPAVLAWYLNDELPRRLVPDLTEYYERVKAADPNHPCFIVLCNRSELPYFTETTDILGVDPYPIPKGPVTEVSRFTDAAHAAVKGTKPIWQVPQAFAWYQYNSENKDRGHLPTAEELKTGRAPNFEEARCMTYLALAHGAKGLIYYCYYDLRVLPQYDEMWGWMRHIGSEVKTLMPVLLSPEDLGEAKFTPAEAPLHTKLKRCDGRLWLIAVNPGQAPVRATFALGQRLPKQVEVKFEDRSLKTAGRKLTDDFAPLEAHVYDLGPAKR